MIKRTTVKTLSVLLALIMCLSLLPATTFTVFAADGIQMRLEKLKEEFPDGMYWNHQVKSESDKIVNILKNYDESYADSVTSNPCTDHIYPVGRGSFDCNYFDGGYQCHGFAARLFYKIFGVRQSTLPTIENKVLNIQPGDLVRLKNNTHSGIVLSVSGLRMTIAECNMADSGEIPSCKIKWGRSCSVTDVTFYVHAPNYEKVKADTNWKSFSSKLNIGSGFYGGIVNNKSNKALTVGSDGKTVIRDFTGAASQMWKFERLSDGTYKIISCLNGKALTLKDNVTAARADIILSEYAGYSGQKWGFFGSSSAMYISPECSRSVLCIEGGVYNDGTKVWVTEKISHPAQVYSVVKKSVPSKSTVSATGGVNTAALSWTKSEGATSYTLELYRDGTLYKTYKNVSVLSGKLTLPAGTYQAKIYSNNSFTSVEGNAAYFTVSEKGVLGKTAKVTSSQTTSSLTLSWTAVPGATGYRIYYQNEGKWKKCATLTGTSHTFSKLSAGARYTFAIRAYSISGSVVTWAPAYTTFTAATKPSAPSKVTATQNTSAIKLTWPAVRNADGYRIYYMTSSGWKAHSETAATGKTFTGLSSAKEYTFAVRPYIKTSLGVVWADYRTCATATKPAKPVISAENIKNLSANILWKTVEGADGYQVFYRLDNTSYKLLNDLDKNKRGLGISEMEYGTYYTFAVRAYKVVGNTKIYSQHSEIRIRAKYL